MDTHTDARTGPRTAAAHDEPTAAISVGLLRYRVRSQSDPDVWYDTDPLAGYCTCPARIYCKHLRWMSDPQARAIALEMGSAIAVVRAVGTGRATS